MRELISTTAHVTKCGWGSMAVEARGELVGHLTQQSAAAAQPSSQRAVELLVAIVSAFASTSMRVTSLAVPVDYHVSCHIGFQVSSSSSSSLAMLRILGCHSTRADEYTTMLGCAADRGISATYVQVERESDCAVARISESSAAQVVTLAVARGAVLEL